MKNLLVTILLCLAITKNIYADCGHCFTLIKVELTFNTNETEIGYIKFFDEYRIMKNDSTPNVNEDISHFIKPPLNSIYFIKKFYKIKGLPEFIDPNDKRLIKLEDVKSIYLLEWTKIQGAIELPLLEHESIMQIINSKTIETQLKSFDVHDEIYIKTNQSLSSKDFNTLIKMSYNYADNSYYMLGKVKYNRKNKTFPSIDEAKRIITKEIDTLRKKITAIDNIKINTNIDSYFQAYKSHLQRHLDYTESILEYIETGKNTSMLSFINNNNFKEHIKNWLLEATLKEESKIEKIINFCSKEGLSSEDWVLTDLFYEVLKKENIIVLSMSWD